MTIDMVDVTIHVDEDVDTNTQDQLENMLLERDGVIANCFSKEHPHLLEVEYNPEKVNSSALLKMVEGRGMHGELIGL